MLKRFLILTGILGVLRFEVPASTDSSSVILLEVKGPIDLATVDYVERSLEHAKSRKPPLLILRLDTPRGLDASMREIILQLITSPVPVVTYVAPSGARAACTGPTFFTPATLAPWLPEPIDYNSVQF